jgi:hypothetical protein
MSDREKRLEEIKRIISDHSSQLPEGRAERLIVQFANMMADDVWEDNDELPSLDALSAFLLWLMRGDVSPGIGSNGRGSITAFYRDGDIKHTIDFLPSGKMAINRYLAQKGDSHE